MDRFISRQTHSSNYLILAWVTRAYALCEADIKAFGSRKKSINSWVIQKIDDKKGLSIGFSVGRKTGHFSISEQVCCVLKKQITSV